MLKKATGFEPTACFTPKIDGRVGDYFEWLAAGRIDLATGGAMYSSRANLESLYFGYDDDHLYFRINEPDLLKRLCRDNGFFRDTHFLQNSCIICAISFADNSLTILSDSEVVGSGEAASGQVLELAAPLAVLQIKVGESINLTCHAVRDGRENGRWPAEGHAGLCYRGRTLDENNWSV